MIYILEAICQICQANLIITYIQSLNQPYRIPSSKSTQSVYKIIVPLRPLVIEGTEYREELSPLLQNLN